MDEAFNPLSLTRADFKQKMRTMQNELEAIRTTAQRHKMIMERLEAGCGIMQADIRFIDLESNPNDATTEPEESADYISIHKDTDEPTNYFNQG